MRAAGKGITTAPVHPSTLRDPLVSQPLPSTLVASDSLVLINKGRCLCYKYYYFTIIRVKQVELDSIELDSNINTKLLLLIILILEDYMLILEVLA